MTLPASGPLSLNDIQTEFGGTNPIGMNEYYAGGGLVPPGTTGTYGAVPSSGALSVQNFYGTSNYIPVYIEEIFSTWLATGQGTSFTIDNGIDLSTKGGMVWMKRRSSAQDNYVFDTVRGASNALITNNTIGQYGNSQINSFTTTGFTGSFLANGSTNVFWTFREQPKFFDVVTYTGNGVAGRTVAHNLGSVPGCIIVKRLDTDGSWYVYHRSLGATQWAQLNSLSIQSDITAWNNTNPTSSVFSLGTDPQVNANGGTYVAYIYAHDAGGFGLSGTDNVISCGSFTSDGSATTVSLGYEPQWLLIKDTAANLGFQLFDTMRALRAPTAPAAALYADTNQAENAFVNGFSINATGFTVAQFASTYIYIAIRRGPMKVPTTGTSVYQPVTYAGNDANRVITAGFPVDMAIFGLRDTATSGKMAVTDRLRARQQLLTTQTSAEATAGGLQTNPWDLMTGVKVSGDSGVTNFTPWQYIDWNFRRAPSFFDEVCYTGNGPGTQVVNHNLTVVPELVINKVRSTTSGWTVFQGSTTALTGFLRLNETNGQGGDTLNVSATTITVDSTIGFGMNTSGATYVTYLFATCPGVSKVGRYTGTGTTQVINCGFSAGSRFVMIKRFNSTGPWYVWDSARGIVAGNDPYLLLNSIADEVTNTDFVDTAATGFEISSTAPAEINASGSTFIFLAIA